MTSVRLLPLSALLTSLSLGACNCDEQLYGFPGDLVGVVCSPDTGQSLAGVIVTVKDADGETTELVSGADGVFRAERLAAGPAEVTIADEAISRTAGVEIVAGEEARFDDENCHTPPPAPAPVGSVSGCVCDAAAGVWVAGANVFIVTDAGAVFATGTDAVGCFVLEGVTAGSQLLKIEKGLFYRELPVEIPVASTVAIPSPSSCDPPPPPAESGSVEGRVCAPDGATWLADATVSLDRGDGTSVQDTTDVDGRYRLEGVPAGSRTVFVTKGSFSTSFEVEVIAGQTTVVPEDQCQLEAPEVKIAVVLGMYDRVQDVLADLGLPPENVEVYEGEGFGTTWTADLLEDFATLSQYDIVFLNCGLDDGEFLTPLLANDVAVANLRQFVADGGSVYASDWAYSVVERAWPQSIDFFGNDNGIGSSKRGAVTDLLMGTIVDPVLAASMGSSQIELHYPLPGWVPMAAVGANVKIYIQGDATIDDGSNLSQVPHTVGFNAGAGRVIYTSFHQEPGISPAQERVLQLLMFEL